MATFTIDANGTNMGEYSANSAAEALDAYAQDAGYTDYAAVVAQVGDDAIATQIDVAALCGAAEEVLGGIALQDSYGSGVVQVDGVSYATYAELAEAANLNVSNFTKRGRPAEIEGGKRVNVYLDAASLASAAELGGGNVSEGIRIALAVKQ